jgi:hypothetical protein
LPADTNASSTEAWIISAVSVPSPRLWWGLTHERVLVVSLLKGAFRLWLPLASTSAAVRRAALKAPTISHAPRALAILDRERRIIVVSRARSSGKVRRA